MRRLGNPATLPPILAKPVWGEAAARAENCLDSEECGSEEGCFVLEIYPKSDSLSEGDRPTQRRR